MKSTGLTMVTKPLSQACFGTIWFSSSAILSASPCGASSVGISALSSRLSTSRFLVALPLVRDLLLRAKHLIVAAQTQTPTEHRCRAAALGFTSGRSSATWLRRRGADAQLFVKLRLAPSLAGARSTCETSNRAMRLFVLAIFYEQSQAPSWRQSRVDPVGDWRTSLKSAHTLGLYAPTHGLERGF
jgi:hypothetical protein